MVIIILMKNMRKVIIIFCLLILYAYFINIYSFPSNIVIYNEEQLNYRLCPFLNLSGETSASTSKEEFTKYDLNLCLGNIDLKHVELTIAKNIKIVPLGKMVGLKLFSDGVMIVGFSRN